MSLTKVSPYITKAIEATGPAMLSLDEFVQVTGFPIDGFMLGFYANLDNNMNVYITNSLIEWCGFGSKQLHHNKKEFIRILANFVENEDYWVYSNAEYANYYALENPQNSFGYPDPAEFTGRGLGKTKHIILTTNCFKKVMRFACANKDDLNTQGRYHSKLLSGARGVDQNLCEVSIVSAKTSTSLGDRGK